MHAAARRGTLLSAASKEGLEPLLAMNPKSKDDFEKYSQAIIDLVIKRHQGPSAHTKIIIDRRSHARHPPRTAEKPLFAAFVEMHVRALADSLRDVDIRKAASGLTTLANEKQKEARDKAGGKKKGKGAAKPILGGAKSAARCVICPSLN